MSHLRKVQLNVTWMPTALLLKLYASFMLLVILRWGRPFKCFISAVVWTHFFWYAKTRIWSFTPRSKVATINGRRLWWPNWYTTRSRLFLHYPATNKCGAGPNRCGQQWPCCRSPSGKPFVLVPVITICINGAKFINRNFYICWPNMKNSTFRVMDW